MCNKADFIDIRKGVARSLRIQNGDRLKSLLQQLSHSSGNPSIVFNVESLYVLEPFCEFTTILDDNGLACFLCFQMTLEPSQSFIDLVWSLINMNNECKNLEWLSASKKGALSITC